MIMEPTNAVAHRGDLRVRVRPARSLRVRPARSARCGSRQDWPPFHLPWVRTRGRGGGRIWSSGPLVVLSTYPGVVGQWRPETLRSGRQCPMEGWARQPGK